MNVIQLQGQAIAQAQATDQSHSIPYRPEYNRITKRVTATILLQQISYWWHTNKRKPFYKFRAPCEHEKYREGDSWTEELGMTIYEFDGALKAIGTKIKKGVSKTQALASSLVIYWTDSNRITWYQLNEELFYAAVYCAYNAPQLLESPLSDLLGKREKSIYLGKREKSIYIPSETTTETTTTTPNQPPRKHRNNGDRHNVVDDVVVVPSASPPSLLPVNEIAFNTLRTIGISERASKRLARRYSLPRIQEVVTASDGKATDRPGWVVSALDEGWDVQVAERVVPDPYAGVPEL